MAATLWGKVYYQDRFAGFLRQEPGNRCVFTYDESYLNAGLPPIAFTLPLQEAQHVHEDGLHPFFDNLVAEGWLRDAQARALGVRKSDRFALLLGFGADCAGAVSVLDPQPVHRVNLELTDPQDFAALASRASLSGIQPKLGVVREGHGYRPARAGERSTHIAKLPSGGIRGIIENEYLTTLACKALLKGDEVVEVRLAPVEAICEQALIVTRFDRSPSGQRSHFEEFNQLLGKVSEDKYEGDYAGMAAFISAHPDLCLPVDLDRLYRRILVCILTGNTDAHFKNFAMLHTTEGLRLAPAYDIEKTGGIDDTLKPQLSEQMQRRWNGTFASIGRYLSKKR